MKKLKNIFSIAFILMLTGISHGQEVVEEDCGISLTEKDVRELYHKLPPLQKQRLSAESFVDSYLKPVVRSTTSIQLAEGLRKAGFDVPDDYFRLDENQKINRSFAEHAVSKVVNESSNNTTIYYHDVWITVHRRTNVQLIADELIYEAMAQLNHAFASNNAPIRFRVKQIERVNNSPFSVNPDTGDVPEMVLSNRDPENRSLHLYIVDQIARPMGINGRAPVIYHSTFMDNEHIAGERNWTTVVHEFGHVLGLLHTHQGRPALGYSWISNFDQNNEDQPKCRQESVSRSKKQGLFCNSTGTQKCRINGDMFCDTRASPRFIDENYDFEGCSYTGTGQDKWGARWSPQNANFMSYAGQCRSTFTAEQVAYMVGEGQPDSWAWTDNPPYALEGPTEVCAYNTYTFRVSGPLLPSSNRYNWVIPEGWDVVGPPNSSTLRVYINREASSGQVVVMPNGLNTWPLSKFVATRFIQLNPDRTGFTKCEGDSYVQTANEAATWTFSNRSWTIVSGQNTNRLTYIAGTGSNTITGRSVACGRTASLTYFSSSSACGGGGGPIRSVAEKEKSPVVKPSIISAYPNPSSGAFKLALGNDTEKLFKVTVLHGSEVYNEFYTRESNVDLNLPNHSMPYIIVIETENGTETLKLISQ